MSNDELEQLKKSLKQELKNELFQELKKEIKKTDKSEALPDQKNEASSLDSRVKKWLGEQGFPLEMQVASIAREAGFDVAQSEFYVDPETKEVREIDLVLSITEFTEELGAYLTYNLFVECKSSKDKPWLMFSTPTEASTPENLGHIIHANDAVISNGYGIQLLFDCINQGYPECIFPRLDSEPWLGYGITQAFATAGDAPFKASMSAVKAALAHKTRMAEETGPVPFVLSYAVIVIDVPLYAVSYASVNKELNMVEIPVGNLLWKYKLAEQTRTGVFIVTKAALPEFLEQCANSANWLLNVNEEKAQSMIHHYLND